MTDTAGFWFKYHGGENQLPESELRKSMDSIGIELRPYADSNPRRPGILLFENFDRRLGPAMEQCCREAPQRVMAVHLGEIPLAMEDSLDLLGRGIAHILSWTATPNPRSALAARLMRWQKVDRALASAWVRANMAGTSPAWMNALRLAAEAAMFSRAPILLQGETGTGKELISRLIHTLDPSPDKGGLIVLDCSTIVSGLSGSEFFGHEKGAFTHAIGSRDGAFAMADKGTLFLDEIGELPLAEQAELLRATQEKKIKRVGGQDWKLVDCRLVSATNRNLLEEIEKGKFRKDLYHRLAGWVIHLPCLEDRQEDILILAEYFAKEILGAGQSVELDPHVQQFLLTRKFPGNIRELRHLVHLMASRCGPDGLLTLGDAPQSFLSAASAAGAQSHWSDLFDQAVRIALLRKMTLREITRQTYDRAVEQALKSEGSLRAAASALGVHRRTLELRQSDRRNIGRHSMTEERALENSLG